MLTLARGWIVALSTLLLASCVSASGAVTVLRAAQVARGATIAWAAETDTYTQSAVERALVQRGYRVTRAADAADYLIGLTIGYRQRAELCATDGFAGPAGISCDNFGCSSGFAWGQIGAPQIRTVNVVERTIILELTARQTQQLVWRATSQRAVETADEPTDRALTTLVQTLP